MVTTWDGRINSKKNGRKCSTSYNRQELAITKKSSGIMTLVQENGEKTGTMTGMQSRQNLEKRKIGT
jgi:hypothetical protein